jgi:hypothetical protein
LFVVGQNSLAMGLQSGIWATLGAVVTFYFTSKQTAQIVSAKDDVIASKDHEIEQIVATHERSIALARSVRRRRIPRRQEDRREGE